MKKYLIITAILSLSFVALTAQSDQDAFRLSQTNWGGTARFIGAGGAFGAVGAEYSALSINPGSIGLYKRSELSFTPFVLSFYNTGSTYNGEESHFLRSNYSLSNFGLVLQFNTTSSAKWKGVQVAFGYNRINDFNNAYRTRGQSNGSTIMDNYVQNANGKTPSDFDTETAFFWNNGLIDPKYYVPEGQNPTEYVSVLSNENYIQERYSKTTGGIDEMNISFGGNYDDKLFLGATIGIPFLNYREYITFEEEDHENTIYGWSKTTIDDYIRQKGAGVNLKVGAIYQPVDFFRFGLAIHTPTFYSNIKYTFERDITLHMRDIVNLVDENGEETGEIEEGGTYTQNDGYRQYFDYRLTTPLRAIASVAFIIDKRAFISADYEITDYSMAKMFSSDYSFNHENRAIAEKYGLSHTVRVGAEVYLTKMFLLRAGYAFKSNPYQSDVNKAPIHTASAGFGIRSKSFFFDMAYQLQLSKEDYWMYDSELVSVVNNQYMSNKVVATVGFKF